MSFFQELKRRNVVRVGIAYAVATWLLIQVTDIVFPRIGLPDSAVTLVIALLAIGFIPALIFAWAFEMTPEGIKREKDVDRANSITSNTAKKLDRVIIGIMAVIIAFLVIDRFTGQAVAPQASPAAAISEDKIQASGSRSPSIAVLPFINMSNDADNEYFSDGISEELLNVLVKVSALKVASRTSAFAYKGKDTPIPQIARELDVDHVLEGSVRKAGNRVRITAQLIDTESDRHLWSETYERELDDIFEIQEEISNAIVSALKIALDVGEVQAVNRAQRPTDNAEAYELYLQGRHAWRLRHEDNIRLSMDLFERAVALDPEFARAYEGLASSWGILPSWSDVSATESTERAADYARKALQLDPTLAEARSQLAEEAAFRHQWQAAIDQYQTALKNEPRNPTPLQWYAEMLQNLGYHRQALDTMLQAYAMDPASPVINASLVWIAATVGDDKTARRHAEISHRLGVGKRAEGNLFFIYMRAGQWDTMLKILQDNDAPPYAYTCLEALKDPSLQAGLANELRQFTDLLEAGFHEAGYIDCMAVAGEAELAASWLIEEEALHGDPLTIFWFNSPGSAAMRQTEAFKAYLSQLELPQFYRQHGWPDRCHPLGEEDFACE